MIQAAQVAVAVAPLDYQDYPVDIQIRIGRRGEMEYKAEIYAMGQWHPVSVTMSLNDPESLNEQFRKEAEAIANETEWQKLQGKALQEKIRPLAEVGNSAYKQIFPNVNDRIALEDLLNKLGANSSVSIQVTSEDFFLPWELIYPIDLYKPLSFNNFWGMNHIISRIIVQGSHPWGFVSNSIYSGPKITIGLLTDATLPSVASREIPFFDGLDKGGEISLIKLRPLDPTKKIQEMQEFKLFWHNSLNLAHFACHASYENKPNRSHIWLSDDFAISLYDMDSYDIVLNWHPLIIMNACETGILNPLYTMHFAANFLKLGARGVVATECVVPDTFAATFSKHLYERLLAGKYLGQSLLATRRALLELPN